METIQNTKEKLVLRMDANESLANALRRSITEIPTLAVDDVEIYKNDSALYDEIIAHRLGLVPLKTDKNMNSKTKVEFKLSKKGPCTVYSGDLQGAGEIVHENIPITLLEEGKKIELLATARLGLGKEHAKHIPGLCYYRHILEIKSSLQVDKVINGAKNRLIKPQKKGSTWVCDISDAEITQIEEMGKGAIRDSGEILFIIESYGNMQAKDIFIEAIKVIESNLDELAKKIK